MLYNVTYHGLHNWTEHAFEKFGWMLLAQKESKESSNESIREDKKLKIIQYGRMLDNLHKAIKEQIEETKDDDRKRDLTVLQKNVKTLTENYEMIFGLKISNKNNNKNENKNNNKNNNNNNKNNENNKNNNKKKNNNKNNKENNNNKNNKN